MVSLLQLLIRTFLCLFRSRQQIVMEKWGAFLALKNEDLVPERQVLQHKGSA